MRYLTPSPLGSPHDANYQRARHDTLNFETCGAERSTNDDVPPEPLGQMLYFSAKAAARVVVTTQGREDQMSNHESATNGASESEKSRRRRSEHERTESFSPTGPVHVKISTRSGDVRVRTTDGDQLEVTLRVNSSTYDNLLELAVIDYDASRNELDIQTQPGDFTGSFRGLRGSPRSWFDFGSSDLDVFVVLPAGSSLEVKSLSGDVSLHGALHDVYVSSISGDVSAFDTCQNLELKTASGDVVTGHVLDVLKCRSASGDVRCAGAATKTDVASASGDVDLAADRPGDIVVKAVSGDVRVRVARGLVVDVNGNTVSGDLGTNIDLNATGEGTKDEEVIFIKVNTVSGDIRIDKAS